MRACVECVRVCAFGSVCTYVCAYVPRLHTISHHFVYLILIADLSSHLSNLSPPLSPISPQHWHHAPLHHTLHHHRCIAAKHTDTATGKALLSLPPPSHTLMQNSFDEYAQRTAHTRRTHMPHTCRTHTARTHTHAHTPRLSTLQTIRTPAPSLLHSSGLIILTHSLLTHSLLTHSHCLTLFVHFLNLLFSSHRLIHYSLTHSLSGLPPLLSTSAHSLTHSYTQSQDTSSSTSSLHIGFDRLLDYGFTAAEVTQLRQQFHQHRMLSTGYIDPNATCECEYM